MKTTMYFLFCCVAAVLMSGNVSAQTYMTEDEIMNDVIGKIVTSLTVSTSEPYAQHFVAHKKGKPKGKSQILYHGERYPRPWRVKKGKLCQGKRCFSLERIDDNNVRAYEGDVETPHPWVLHSADTGLEKALDAFRATLQ